MFAYSSASEILPTLTFTKAELIFALTRLLEAVDDNDNSTRLELVELRHYLNLVKEEVNNAAIKHELSLPKPQLAYTKPSSSPTPQKTNIPNIQELKRQFPSLSEEEIKEIVNKARREAEKEEEKKSQDSISPPIPSFVAKSTPLPLHRPTSPQDEKNKEASQKFAALLGSQLL